MQRYYSSVYWHFTGSPDVDWNDIKTPKEIKGKAKATKESVDILKKIISTKRLLAGKPEVLYGEVKTERFCCVCDIPFKDLIQHSDYYGKVAIGFSANSIHKCFNPVLYVQKDFYNLLNELKFDLDKKLDLKEDLDYEILANDFWGALLGLEGDLKYNERLSISLGYFKNLMKVTRFSETDDETFYREREWRKIGDFDFSNGDVEAIIVPKKHTIEFRKYLYEQKYNNAIVLPFEFIEKV